MSTDRLIQYIVDHTERGECQCGQCADKQADREAPPHSVHVHFFWVSAKNAPTKEELLALLEAEYPSMDRLRAGPSYIEIGAEIGDQGLALRLIGLGALVGLWEAITPAIFGFEGADAEHAAGGGLIMPSGISTAQGRT